MNICVVAFLRRNLAFRTLVGRWFKSCAQVSLLVQVTTVQFAPAAGSPENGADGKLCSRARDKGAEAHAPMRTHSGGKITQWLSV